MQGHGYFKGSGGVLSRMRSYPEGYPYMQYLDNGLYDESEDDEEDTLDDVEKAVKVSNTTLGDYGGSDSFGAHAKDRRSFTSSNNFGLPNVPVFAEADLHEIGASIRLRPRSSEPKGSRPFHPEPTPAGSMYGWSSPPQWKEPPRKADEDNYRFEDIVGVDEEEEFENLRDRHDHMDEQVLRGYIRLVLSETLCR